MTLHQTQLQALITEIESLLGQATPRLPWVMTSETNQQRRLLEQTLAYLKELHTEGSPSLDWHGPTASPPPSPEDAHLRSDNLESSSQQVLQALLQEIQYLRTQTIHPLANEVLGLQKQREALNNEIRQLELHRLELSGQDAPRPLQPAWTDDLVSNLRASLIEQLVPHFKALQSQIDNAPILNSASQDPQEIAADLPQLQPQQRLDQLRRIQVQTDTMLLRLDSDIRTVFESMENSIQSYCESLTQRLDDMHSLGEQGEVIFRAFVNHLAQQLGQESNYLLQADEGVARLLEAEKSTLDVDDDHQFLEDAASEALLPDSLLSLEDIDLDNDIQDGEEITLFQLDEEITQLQLDDEVAISQGINEPTPFGEEGDSTVIQTEPISWNAAIDRVMAASSEEEETAAPLSDGDREATGSDYAEIDALYESLFGETNPSGHVEDGANLASETSTPDTQATSQLHGASQSPELIHEDLDAALLSPESWGSDQDMSDAAIASASAPPNSPDQPDVHATIADEADLSFSEPVDSTLENLLDPSDLVADTISSPTPPPPRATPNEESDNAIAALWGAEMAADLATPETAVSDTISSLSELLPASEDNETPQVNDPFAAFDESLADTFIPAPSDEDLLESEIDEASTWDIDVSLDNDAMERLNNDLSNLEGLSPEEIGLSSPPPSTTHSDPDSPRYGAPSAGANLTEDIRSTDDEVTANTPSSQDSEQFPDALFPEEAADDDLLAEILAPDASDDSDRLVAEDELLFEELLGEDLLDSGEAALESIPESKRVDPDVSEKTYDSTSGETEVAPHSSEHSFQDVGTEQSSDVYPAPKESEGDSSDQWETLLEFALGPEELAEPTTNDTNDGNNSIEAAFAADEDFQSTQLANDEPLDLATTPPPEQSDRGDTNDSPGGQSLAGEVAINAWDNDDFALSLEDICLDLDVPDFSDPAQSPTPSAAPESSPEPGIQEDDPLSNLNLDDDSVSNLSESDLSLSLDDIALYLELPEAETVTPTDTDSRQESTTSLLEDSPLLSDDATLEDLSEHFNNTDTDMVVGKALFSLEDVDLNLSLEHETFQASPPQDSDSALSEIVSDSTSGVDSDIEAAESSSSGVNQPPQADHPSQTSVDSPPSLSSPQSELLSFDEFLPRIEDGLVLPDIPAFDTEQPSGSDNPSEMRDWSTSGTEQDSGTQPQAKPTESSQLTLQGSADTGYSVDLDEAGLSAALETIQDLSPGSSSIADVDVAMPRDRVESASEFPLEATIPINRNDEDTQDPTLDTPGPLSESELLEFFPPTSENRQDTSPETNTRQDSEDTAWQSLDQDTAIAGNESEPAASSGVSPSLDLPGLDALFNNIDESSLQPPFLEATATSPEEQELGEDFLAGSTTSGPVAPSPVSPAPVQPPPDIDDQASTTIEAQAGTNVSSSSRTTSLASSELLATVTDDRFPPESPAPPPPTPAQAEWFLGLDLGTSGLSAVLMNRTTGSAHPLYWSNQASRREVSTTFRLPAVAALQTPVSAANHPWQLQAVGMTALAAVGTEASNHYLLSHLKPLLTTGIPYLMEPETWEPTIQVTDEHTVPLQQILASVQALLSLVKQTTSTGVELGAAGLETAQVHQVLDTLQGVIIGHPSHWSDTYRLNLREAILAARLVPEPSQIFFVEEAIAAILSGLPDPEKLPEPADRQAQTLYQCNWQGGTVVISAGSSCTELGIVELPHPLDALSWDDFALRTIAYGGDALDLDIICQLLVPPERRKPRPSSDRYSSPTTAEGWTSPATAGLHAQWAELGLESWELPQLAEPEESTRIRLRQHLESSQLGRSLLETARYLKLILQHQGQCQLDLADQSWKVLRRDLEGRVLVPYIQRLNQHLNALLSQVGLPSQGINQVVCTGGNGSFATLAKWLRQKFPNATIIQDTYPSNRPPSCSRTAYGLVNLCRYPQVLDMPRHQYNDYFLLSELMHTVPDQPLPLNGILHLLQERGINVDVCRSRILALLEGHLPPGLLPQATTRAYLSMATLNHEAYQDLSAQPLFTQQSQQQIYALNPQQRDRMQAYLGKLLAHKHQSLAEPLIAQLVMP